MTIARQEADPSKARERKGCIWTQRLCQVPFGLLQSGLARSKQNSKKISKTSLDFNKAQRLLINYDLFLLFFKNSCILIILYTLPNSSKILTLLPTQLHVFFLSLSLLKQLMKIKTKNKFLSVCLSHSFACVCRVPREKTGSPTSRHPLPTAVWLGLGPPFPSHCWDFCLVCTSEGLACAVMVIYAFERYSRFLDFCCCF